MLLALISCPDNGRKCRHFITGLIKSKMVACIQRINYVKSYYIREGDLKAENEKILLLKLKAENKDKVTHYIYKNHPYDTPEIIRLNPDDVDEKYMNWVKGN